MAQRLASHAKAGSSSKAGSTPNPKAQPAQQGSLGALRKQLAARKAKEEAGGGGEGQQEGEAVEPGSRIEADRFLTEEDFVRIKRLKHRWGQGQGAAWGGRWRGRALARLAAAQASAGSCGAVHPLRSRASWVRGSAAHPSPPDPRPPPLPTPRTRPTGALWRRRCPSTGCRPPPPRSGGCWRRPRRRPRTRWRSGLSAPRSASRPCRPRTCRVGGLAGYPGGVGGGG
jgi:hypothetical protein